MVICDAKYQVRFNFLQKLPHRLDVLANECAPGGRTGRIAKMKRALHNFNDTKRERIFFSLELVPTDDVPIAVALPRQFIAIRSNLGPGRLSLLRTYSLSGPPGDKSYRLAIKKGELALRAII